uniref:Uncharacterized protein n=1 Tax=Romanomermis culicivorax TaxID=13658 RepID=A0A915JIA8_ROMCU
MFPTTGTSAAIGAARLCGRWLSSIRGFTIPTCIYGKYALPLKKTDSDQTVIVSTPNHKEFNNIAVP